MTQQPENPQANPPTPAAEIPRFAVLEKQLALIGIQEDRLGRLLVQEHLAGKYARAVTETIRRLQALYSATLRTQQELGLVPAYRRGPRPPETAPPEEVVRHPMYPFLSSDEARDLFMMEELAKQGKIDVAEAYKLAGAINRYEEEQEAKRGNQ